MKVTITLTEEQAEAIDRVLVHEWNSRKADPSPKSQREASDVLVLWGTLHDQWVAQTAPKGHPARKAAHK